MDVLESRIALSPAFPDFPGPVDVAFVPGGPVAYGPGVGGGPRVKVELGGRTVFDQFVFEDTFRGGVRVGLADVNGDGYPDLCVGPGPGGGPRVRVFAASPGGYTPAADYFALDPGFRGGVYVEGWGTTLAVFAGDGGGPVGVLGGVARLYGHEDARDAVGWVLEDADGDGSPEVFRATRVGCFEYDTDGRFLTRAWPLLGGVYYAPPALAAAPHAAMPGNVALANKVLGRIPAWLQRYLAETGMAVLVYSGSAVTQLPEFAYLRGVRTPADGDGDRTYDGVPAVAPTDWRSPAVVIETSGDVVLHEVGHGVWLRLDPAARAAWAGVWRGSTWRFEYQRLDETEAFGASFSRWVREPESNPPAVASVFAHLVDSLRSAEAGPI